MVSNCPTYVILHQLFVSSPYHAILYAIDIFTWMEINLSTPSFLKASSSLLLVLLMCDKWSDGFPTNHLLSFVNLPSHHQFLETWIMVAPFGTLLSMLIIARESPSTINGFHWCCKAQYTPLMRPSTPLNCWY